MHGVFLNLVPSIGPLNFVSQIGLGVKNGFNLGYLFFVFSGHLENVAQGVQGGDISVACIVLS